MTPRQCINSIDRALLNEDLLLEALAVPNVRIFFGHKVISANFDARVLYVQDSESQKEITVPFDFCVGADGSYSIIRRQLMRIVRYVFPYLSPLFGRYLLNNGIFYLTYCDE